jgi:subtilisin family serine protease
LQVPEFWEAYPDARGQGVTVCIVDTGLFREHEDAPMGVKGSDDIDLVNPWYEDGYTHGSHVTGIVAASDNDIGVVGVAPEANIFIARGM